MGIQSADKKPEKYTTPDGKSKIRMVPVDKEVIKREASAPKIDLQKFKAHMNRNKKPKKMSSTQKALSDISKRANKRANEEWVLVNVVVILVLAKDFMKTAAVNHVKVRELKKKLPLLCVH